MYELSKPCFTCTRTHGRTLAYTKYELFSLTLEHSHLLNSLPRELPVAPSPSSPPPASPGSQPHNSSWPTDSVLPTRAVPCSELWQSALLFSLAIFPVGCLLFFIPYVCSISVSWPRVPHLVSSLSSECIAVCLLIKNGQRQLSRHISGCAS